MPPMDPVDHLAARPLGMFGREVSPTMAGEAGLIPDSPSALGRAPRNAMARLENWLMRGADAVAARYSARPPRENLKDLRIVAHRGIYDNRTVFENTLPAFDAVRDAGIWGVECDVRWTRDRVAVVHHDPDGRRLFGFHRPIETFTYRELQRVCPLIPTLAAVVRRYGRRLHLMLEIKPPARIHRRDVNRSLAADLAPLAPGENFHLMSLSLPYLTAIDAVPRCACLPIARLNPRAAARAVDRYGYGGLTGHYAVIRRGRIRAVQQQGRRVGTGFVNSRGCLYREMARGVDWLFSDRTLDLQRIAARLLAGA